MANAAKQPHRAASSSSKDPAAFCPWKTRRVLFLLNKEHVGISTSAVITSPRSCPGTPYSPRPQGWLLPPPRHRLSAAPAHVQAPHWLPLAWGFHGGPSKGQKWLQRAGGQQSQACCSLSLLLPGVQMTGTVFRWYLGWVNSLCCSLHSPYHCPVFSLPLGLLCKVAPGLCPTGLQRQAGRAALAPDAECIRVPPRSFPAGKVSSSLQQCIRTGRRKCTTPVPSSVQQFQGFPGRDCLMSTWHPVL